MLSVYLSGWPFPHMWVLSLSFPKDSDDIQMPLDVDGWHFVMFFFGTLPHTVKKTTKTHYCIFCHHRSFQSICPLHWPTFSSHFKSVAQMYCLYACAWTWYQWGMQTSPCMFKTCLVFEIVLLRNCWLHITSMLGNYGHFLQNKVRNYKRTERDTRKNYKILYNWQK